MTPPTRRSVLLALGLGGAALALPAPTPAAAEAGGGDFTTARTAWRAALVGDGWDPADPALAPAVKAIGDTAAAHRAKLVPKADRTAAGLFTDVVIPADHSTSAPLSTTVQRLRAMALAWATPGAAGHGDAGLLADTADGLDWFAATAYTASGSEWANWFDWEIGVPLALNDAILLILDSGAAPADKVAAWLAPERHFVPSVPLDGTKGAAANRVNFCDSVAGRGILSENADEVAEAISGLKGVLEWKDGATGFYERDGFYSDGSFTQHGDFPYAAGYGASLMSSIANVLGRTASTAWAVTDPMIAQWIHRAFEPLFWDGVIMDMTAGRDVSFASYTDLGSGRSINRSMLQLLPGLADADRPAAAAFVKRNLLDADGTTPPSSWPIPSIVAARALLADAKTPARGPLTGSRVFGVMDRVVHRSRDWAVGIAMNSPRIASYETGNNENLHGWYTGDGMVYLYLDNQQYGGGFWPTVDPYRLPGTTVDTTPRQPVNVPWTEEYCNPEPFVGGVALDVDGGGAAAAAMALKADKSQLTARKSWFTFPDRVVALGAAITAPGSPGVVTTVENRRLTGSPAGEDAALLVDGAKTVPGDGDAAAPGKVRWAHLDGTAGYVFPEPVTLHALRETRKGAYSDIDHGGTGAGGPSYTNRYLTLHLDHGAAPSGAGYAYTVLPGASAAETAAEAESPTVHVLAHTAGLHAVHHPRLGVLAALFFEADGKTAAGGRLRAVDPCAAVLREGADRAELALSDPTQKRGTVAVEVLGPWRRAAAAAPHMTVERIAGGVRITADTAGAAGDARRVELSR